MRETCIHHPIAEAEESLEHFTEWLKFRNQHLDIRESTDG